MASSFFSPELAPPTSLPAHSASREARAPDYISTNHADNHWLCPTTLQLKWKWNEWMNDWKNALAVAVISLQLPAIPQVIVLNYRELITLVITQCYITKQLCHQGDRHQQKSIDLLKQVKTLKHENRHLFCCQRLKTLFISTHFPSLKISPSSCELSTFRQHDIKNHHP